MTDVIEKERTGRPSTENLDRKIEQCLTNDPHATSREISKETGCHHFTICRHLVAMGKKFLVNRWIPHKLSEENKSNRIRICNELLAMYRENNFLKQLITLDEVWIYWDNEGRGKMNRSWRGAGDLPNQVVRRNNMTTRKIMATVFWDCKGVLLFHVLTRNVSITAEYYCFIRQIKICTLRKA